MCINTIVIIFAYSVHWLKIMLQRIPVQGLHNLFLFTDAKGNLVLVTYRDLTVQMRQWLKKIGITNHMSFSSHSLRRGGSCHAFNNDIPDSMIKLLGDWASNAYQHYIDLTVETRLKAWFLIPK